MFSNRKIFFFTLEDTLALAPYIIAKNSQLQLQELGRTSTGFNEEPNDAPGSHCTRLWIPTTKSEYLLRRMNKLQY